MLIVPRYDELNVGWTGLPTLASVQQRDCARGTGFVLVLRQRFIIPANESLFHRFRGLHLIWEQYFLNTFGAAGKQISSYFVAVYGHWGYSDLSFFLKMGANFHVIKGS